MSAAFEKVEARMNRKLTVEILSLNWEILAEMVAAGYNSDIAQLKRAGERLEDEVPVDRTAGRFIFYLLWRRVTQLYGTAPTADDVSDLARHVEPKVARILDITRNDIEKTIATPLGLLNKDEMASEMELIGLGAVIFGCLIDVYPGDLEALKSDLVAWYRKKYSY